MNIAGRFSLSVVVAVAITTTGASAQDAPEELFTPVPGNQLINPTPSQSKRVEQIRRRKTTGSVDFIRINAIALRGNELRFTIPGHGRVVLTRTGGEMRRDQVTSWSGAEQGRGPVGANATFVIRDGQITGSMTVEGTLYRVTPIGDDGVHALIKVDTRKMPPEEPPGSGANEDHADALADFATSGEDLTSNGDTGTTEIDVMVAYTAAAKAAVGDIAAKIALAIAESNQSYVNSVINLRLNLVDSFQVSYTEAGKSFPTMVSDFKNMAVVNQRRNQFGADVAVLLVDQDDYCGRADAILATAATAFAVVHYDCATGYYSFAHEIGHLMGARHNQQEDASLSPYAYGHGFRRDVYPSFRTVMSYDCPAGCTRVKYWSNPRLTYAGVAMGTVATNDNARVLNRTATTIAAFRARPVPDGSIWRYTGVPCSGTSCPGWQILDNNVRSRAIVTAHGAAVNDLYQLHSDGKIWRYTGTPCGSLGCPGWQMLDNNRNTVAIAADVVGYTRNLYQLHNDGSIWRYTGTPCGTLGCPGWQKLDANPATVAIEASGGNLYQRHYNGMIWRYTGTPCGLFGCPGWQLLDNNPRTMAILADGSRLYQLHNNGRIWRYTGTPCTGSSCPGWQMLDNNPSTASIVASGGNLYQRHSTGRVWRYTGVPCSGSSCPGWQLLDNNPSTVAITADASRLYQLHNSGRVWRYTGLPCSGTSCPGWQLLDSNARTVAITAGAAQLYQIHGVD